MGFDVNFNNNKPIIKEAQAMHDGGAGNLGYFEREEKKKKNSEKSIFSEANSNEDTFEKGSENDDFQEQFSISKLIAEIILGIKDWFKNLFKSN